LFPLFFLTKSGSNRQSTDACNNRCRAGSTTMTCLSGCHCVVSWGTLGSCESTEK